MLRPLGRINCTYTNVDSLPANRKGPGIFWVGLPLLRRGRGVRSNAWLNAQLKYCHPANLKRGYCFCCFLPDTINYIYTNVNSLPANIKGCKFSRVGLPLLRRGRGVRSNAGLNAQLKYCHPANLKRNTAFVAPSGQNQLYIHQCKLSARQ